MREIIIVGGGFAGVWAARAVSDAGRRHGVDVSVTLVSRDRWLTLRPRLYEDALEEARVPLDAAVDVNLVEGQVTRIDAAARIVVAGGRSLAYDRLILAAGSRTHRPAIPGMEHAFGVDSHAEATALRRHLAAQPGGTAVVVGAGFTGLEVATELSRQARVVLVGAAPQVAPDLGPEARRHVERALAALAVETRPGRRVTEVRPDGVTLDGGDRIAATTTVWTGGFRASPLAEQLGVALDEHGRVPVDPVLRARGVDAVYVAGDMARVRAGADHLAPMSCQFAIPMGELAGRNAVADLAGVPGAPFTPAPYVTCLDLGPAGALFMEGWDRAVRLTGWWAKVMKQTINERLIRPPLFADRRAAA